MTEEALQHVLVPKHEKISDKDKKNLFEQYQISEKDLPKIPITDPAIRHMSLKVGDVIKITRVSPTAGHVYFYRGVSNE
ncbi:DNA-directed RNA polymerase subunit H [Candidatus Woesearchaeota archaeon]|nr:DNA-directed RNA polymerase subunit H [Candidatus Woesearchaeota archaeon]